MILWTCATLFWLTDVCAVCQFQIQNKEKVKLKNSTYLSRQSTSSSPDSPALGIWNETRLLNPLPLNLKHLEQSKVKSRTSYNEKLNLKHPTMKSEITNIKQ